MKEYNRLDEALLSGSESFKGKLVSLVNNMGKAVAAIAAMVAALITFTDITLSELSLTTFVPSLIAMLICSYVIYFSMEDAGEDLGKSSEEYIAACKKYKNEREQIGGMDIEPMRSFCNTYAKEELVFRKEGMMLTYGISKEEITAFAHSLKASKSKRSVMHLLVNLRLPAPIKANFFIIPLLYFFSLYHFS